MLELMLWAVVFLVVTNLLVSDVQTVMPHVLTYLFMLRYTINILTLSPVARDLDSR